MRHLLAAVVLTTISIGESSPTWKLSRLNDDNSWQMTCQSTSLAIDPWVVPTPASLGLPNIVFEVPFVNLSWAPVPLILPETLATQTDAILTSLSFGDHSHADTLKRMTSVPMYLPQGTDSVPNANVTTLPQCATDRFLSLPGDMSVCHHPSSQIVGNVYKQGMLWIRSPCGAIIFAPHGTLLPEKMNEKISKSEKPLALFACSIYEAALLGASWVKPGPEAAVNLAAKLNANSYYTTHNYGDYIDTGIVWDSVVRYLPSQAEMRDFVGVDVYKAAHDNVSIWPETVTLGMALVGQNVGTGGIPFGIAVPGTRIVYTVLAMFAPAFLLAVVLFACGHERRLDSLWSLAIMLTIVPSVIALVLIVASSAYDPNRNFWWFLNTAYPNITWLPLAVSWTAIIGTFVPYGAQTIYASAYLSDKDVNSWYAAIIFLNCLAMTLVSFRMVFDNLINSSDTMYTAEFPVIFAMLYVIIIFPTHTICNVTRLVFDVWGVEAAKRCMLPAYFTQAWLILPFCLGVEFSYLMIALAIIDYMQHTTALVYWLYGVCKVDLQNIDRIRYQASIVGVIFHMISLFPLFFFFYPGCSFAAAEFTVLWMEASMLISQFGWIRAMQNTLPSESNEFEKTSSGESSQDESVSLDA